jgi:TolB-like protein/DNA-binding winged helix-turn-helix (wHTH) protein
MHAESKSLVYEFGRFLLSPTDRTLFADGVPVPLPAKEFATLLLLVEHNGRALSKEEMMSAIWQDTFVEEGNLAKQISKLRKILNTNGEEYIVTVSKHGYRFNADLKRELLDVQMPIIAERRTVERVALAIENGSEPTAIVPRKKQEFDLRTATLAVLPFINVSSDPENDYFCDGLAEELLNFLSRIDGLKVVARTSVFSFKNKDVDVRTIARMLNVSSVLEGSVRNAGSRLRISVRLVTAPDGYHIWSESYDREMRDIFDLQEEITLAVIGALKVKLLPGERRRLITRAPAGGEVYELYLKGRYFCNKRTDASLRQAVSFYERAIAIDPDFALAHSGLADAYAYLGYAFGTMSPAEAMPKAKAAAIKAQELDPSAAEPHTSLAIVHLFYDWDWAEAENEYIRAAKLDSNYPTNHHFRAIYLATIWRRFDEAITEARLGLSLDPLSVPLHNIVGLLHLDAGHFEDAISMWQKILELDPTSSAPHNEIGWAYELQGDFKRAAEEYALALEISNEPEAASKLRALFSAQGIDGLRRSKVDFFLEKWERYAGWHGHAYSLAVNYGRLGDKKRTLEWLDRAFELRSGLLVWLNIQPAFNFLRTDPAFLDLTSRIGLPDNSG